MAAAFDKHSASASMPSSTGYAPLYNIPVPSLFSAASQGGRWLFTTAAIIVGLLILEQSVYRMKKRHLPGDAWTIPVIGKFADSLKPTIEGYKAQWDSGALSALSVFNMYARFGMCECYESLTRYI
jgi:sterol 22-desaturase